MIPLRVIFGAAALTYILVPAVLCFVEGRKRGEWMMTTWGGVIALSTIAVALLMGVCLKPSP